MFRKAFLCVLCVLCGGEFAAAATSDLADAVMNRDARAVRALTQRHADVNTPQNDGTTALMWAARDDDLDTADLLIRAGARVSSTNRDGVTALQLAAINGSALDARKADQGGSEPECAAVATGDTALMLAARTGKTDAMKVLLDEGAEVNSVGHRGAARRPSCGPSRSGIRRGQAAHRPRRRRARAVQLRRRRERARIRRRTPLVAEANQKAEEFASGWMTALMFAAREGDLASARLSWPRELTSMPWPATAKTRSASPSSTAIRRRVVSRRQSREPEPSDAKGSRRCSGPSTVGTWRRREFPLDRDRRSAAAHQETARRRRQSERLVNNTPRARNARGFAAHRVRDRVDRAAFSADLELAKLLLAHGADPKIKSSDGETMVAAAAGLGFIQGYSRARRPQKTRGGEAVRRSIRCRPQLTPTTTASRR